MKILYYVRAIEPTPEIAGCLGRVLFSKTDAWYLDRGKAEADLESRKTPHIIEEHSLPDEVFDALR